MKTQPSIKKRSSTRSWLGFSFLIFALTGCAKYYYNPAPQILPQYIKKIAIRPFANHTSQFRIEDKLTYSVQNLISQDGRYAITSEEQADGVLIGDITKYILEPLSYDANNTPQQYKLWILVNVSFYDKIRNQTLWTEPNLGNPVTYYSASSGLAGALTEDEAQQEIWNQLAVDITTRTLEGFGTVTGSSDKAVPKVSPDQYPTVPPQEPNAGTTPPVIPNPGTNEPVY
jgi:hypothetical protein